MTPDDNEIFPTTSEAGAAGQGDSILLEFVSFRDFIDRYSANISEEALFIVSEQPRAVGESVSFEVRLSDDFRLIQGRGTVAWAVPVGTPGHEAGMAIRFDEVDEPSRRLITRLVNNHRGEGGAVFDIDAPVEIATPSGEVPEASREASEELFATDPRPNAPAPADESTDELFGESPFQVPAGPETIALPRDLVPSAETPGLDELIEPQQVAEPVHPLGPLAPPEPTAPLGRAPRTPPVEPTLEPESPAVEAPEAPAPAAAGFVEAAVPEVDEDFSPSAETEPAELPEITPPPAQLPIEEPPAAMDRLGPEPPEVEPAPVYNLGGEAPSPFEISRETAVEPDVPLAGDAREIPLAPPEAILESPTDPGAYPPLIEEPQPPSGEPGAGPAPPEISSEISQITHEVAGGPAPDVEMPEPEEIDEDYGASYAASAGAPSAGPGKWLWIGLCLVAIILGGVAAVRYQDTLREMMPWIPGGDDSTQVADRPSLEELRARLLGEKEAEKAAEEARAAAGGGEDGEADGSGAEGTPADPVAQSGAARVPEAAPEAPTEAPTEPVVDSDPAPVTAQADPPAASASPPVGPSSSGTPASAGRVESIDWTDRGGATVVIIATAGPLSRESFDHVRVSEGAPREVIKVFGVSEPFPSRVYEVGGERVVRLRTGSHPGGEVHIVADLADASVKMTAIDVAGRTLRVTFSR